MCASVLAGKFSYCCICMFLFSRLHRIVLPTRCNRTYECMRVDMHACTHNVFICMLLCMHARLFVLLYFQEPHHSTVVLSIYLLTPARVTDGYSQRWRWVDGREECTTRELSVKCAACCKHISKSLLVSLGQISTLALRVGL